MNKQIKNNYNMTIKATDLLAEYLVSAGVKNVFGLQGGAVVHIFDSIEKKKIKVCYMHHEQSCALAAVANSKLSGSLGCVVVTSGPASTNAITGLLAAWQDSTPVIFISGQVRHSTTSYGRKVRQIGTQEAPIINIVKPITKYARCINNANELPTILNQAITAAYDGRRGPVWVDIPLDFQWAVLNNKKLFKKIKVPNFPNLTSEQLDNLKDKLEKASRPLLVLGNGIRQANALAELDKFLEKTDLSFVTTWSGKDFYSTSNPRNLGIIGPFGQRGANKAIFEADLLLCLGTHLPIPQTTTLFENYAPNAFKIIINFDKDQLENLNVKFNLILEADVFSTLRALNELQFDLKKYNFPKLKEMNWYEITEEKELNPNKFLYDFSRHNDVKTCYIIDGGGTALYAGFQSTNIKNGERVICSSSISAMGTGLAETVGSYMTGNYLKFVCIIGDGSFLMNVQDLQSISQFSIPVIIIVINNKGYLAIRHTQTGFLDNKFFGAHEKWGLGLPKISKIAQAFGISHIKIKKPKQLSALYEDLSKDIVKPIIVELCVGEQQSTLFSQGFKLQHDGSFKAHDLSEMKPFL